MLALALLALATSVSVNHKYWSSIKTNQIISTSSHPQHPQHPQYCIPFRPSSEPCRFAEPFKKYYQIFLVWLLFLLPCSPFLQSLFGNSLGMDFRPTIVHSSPFPDPNLWPASSQASFYIFCWLVVRSSWIQNTVLCSLLKCWPGRLGQSQASINHSIPNLIMSGLVLVIMSFIGLFECVGSLIDVERGLKGKRLNSDLDRTTA